MVDNYTSLLRETSDELFDELDTLDQKNNYESIYKETLNDLMDNDKENYQTIFEALIDDYLKCVKSIAKLSPGLATGLKDFKEGITLNVYTGYTSDKSDAERITNNTLFDVASITKFFTALLLLKEEEKGNITLKKCYSDYSDKLINIDVPIINALKFGTEIRTPGRIDEENISIEERMLRFEKAYIHKRSTFIYSDVPYMLVLMLFGNNEIDANINYINKFYKTFKSIGLENTGYFTNPKTGGLLSISSNEEVEIFDPKARQFEFENGFILGHAGVTTTVRDLQKLFIKLNNGFLSNESLDKLITPIINTEYLLDEKGKPVIRKEKKVLINRGMGVYLNLGNLRKSDVAKGYSKKAFASAGSTGTYSVFDLKNGFNATFLSNIKTTSYSKTFFTDNYEYGDKKDHLPKFYKTTLIAGTGTIRDGKLIRQDGSEMGYSRATNNFKNEQFKILLKLRLAKRFLIKKAQLESKDDNEYNNLIKRINDVFDDERYI